mgnify:CR=1 FL=1
MPSIGRTYAGLTHRVDLERQGENNMGRPLNKRYFGATAGAGDGRIPAIVKVGANAVSETGIIISQRSETKFVVNDAANGTGNTGSCLLVDKDVPADNEMVVKGYVAGGGDGVNVRKFYNRTVIDFNDTRYTWEVQDDSTSNILVLTAL